MAEYSKVNVKLSNTQIKKTKRCSERQYRNNYKNKFENASWK